MIRPHFLPRNRPLAVGFFGGDMSASVHNAYTMLFLLALADY